jgi:hypothetical protein
MNREAEVSMRSCSSVTQSMPILSLSVGMMEQRLAFPQRSP